MTHISDIALATVTGGKQDKRFSKENVHGYTPGLTDMSNFAEAAKALKVAPFYKGRDAKPFDALGARLVPDPTIQKGVQMRNDFFIRDRSL